MTIPGVTNVTSANTLGKSEIVLEFGVNKDIDSAAQDVEAAISQATPNLPPTFLTGLLIKKSIPLKVRLYTLL